MSRWNKTNAIPLNRTPLYLFSELEFREYWDGKLKIKTVNYPALAGFNFAWRLSLLLTAGSSLWSELFDSEAAGGVFDDPAERF